jgi:hypothetical protein
MAFPTTPVLDDFSGTLANWTNPVFGASAVVIAAGRLAGTGGAENAAVWTSSFSSDDQEVYYDVPVDTNNQVSLLFMVQDADASPTAYAIEVLQVGDVLRLRRYNNGAATTLQTTTLALAAGDSVGASKIGSLISVYHKPSAGSWTPHTSATDGSPLTGGGQIGTLIEGTGMRIDNFGGGNVASGGPSDDPPVGFLGRGAGW